MLGFELDLWDYITFLSLAIIGLGLTVSVVLIGGLPGRIAIARNHPEAEAVKIMGWAGFLVVVPWIQAFIWAFKPTDVIDIRRFPKAEAKAIDEEIARLKVEPTAEASPAATATKDSAGALQKEQAKADDEPAIPDPSPAPTAPKGSPGGNQE
jgi:hypothetical protein